MSQALTKDPTWPDYINEVMPKFNEIALHTKAVLWKAESQFAIQAIQKSKQLAACVPYTVQNAVINVAAVGLTLNPADGYAFLVPEYNKDLGQKECQLRISFKGLIKVATDSGAISWVKAEIVKEKDTFEYRGISEPPKHIMQPFGDRGATTGVYCVAKTNDGEYLVDTMPKSEINLIRKCAKFDTIWATWFDEMAKKAIIKRASKQWPRTDKSSALNKAVEVITETEGSDEGYLLYTPGQLEEFDDLFEKKDAFGFFSLGIKSGLRADGGGEVWGALIKASKDSVRADKGSTQRGKDITALWNQGNAMYIDMRADILGLAQTGDVDKVQEQFDVTEEYGIRDHIGQSFNKEEQELLKSLKDVSE